MIAVVFTYLLATKLYLVNYSDGLGQPYPEISGGPNRTGLTGFTGPVRYPVRFGPVRYFPQIPNRTFLMKCVPKWYLRLDFTFKSSKVAIFFGQISEISFQSHLIFIIQSFRNFEAGYIWKFICYEVRFGKVRFGSVKITGPVRFGKSGICLVRSTTVHSHGGPNHLVPKININSCLIT